MAATTVYGPWTSTIGGQSFRAKLSYEIIGTTIYVTAGAQCTAPINDTVTLNKAGYWADTSVNRTWNSGAGEIQFDETHRSWAGSYGGSYYLEFSVSGIYNGLSPYVTATITIPAVAPSPPTVAYNSLTARSVHVYTSVPGGSNGAPADTCEYLLLPDNVAKQGSYSDGVDFTGLTPNKGYSVKARAHNSAGWGNYGNTISFTTLKGVPDAPGAPAVSSITSSGASAGVSAPASNGAAIDSYQFQRSTNSSFTAGLVSVTSSTGPVALTGLTRATTYYVRARAHNSVGWGEWSAGRTFKTLAELPTMGTSYGATAITRNSATTTGSSVTDNGGEAPSNLRAKLNTGAVFTKGSWGEVAMTGLAAATAYTFQVAAYNSAGWSAYGPVKGFTTLSDAPDDMGAPVFTELTDTGFKATWAAPAMNGATLTTYGYEFSASPTFAPLISAGTTPTPFITVSGQTPGTRYYVRMRAVASPNNGGWGTGDVTTTGIAPNSGLRAHTFVGGVRKQGTLYTFVGGVRKQLRPMYAHDGIVETE